MRNKTLSSIFLHGLHHRSQDHHHIYYSTLMPQIPQCIYKPTTSCKRWEMRERKLLEFSQTFSKSRDTYQCSISDIYLSLLFSYLKMSINSCIRRSFFATSGGWREWLAEVDDEDEREEQLSWKMMHFTETATLLHHLAAWESIQQMSSVENFLWVVCKLK